MGSRRLFLVALVFATLALSYPSASASISPTFDAEMTKEDTIVVQGSAKVSGFEAGLVRIALDSGLSIPDMGLLGTGNGDGNITRGEVENYTAKAIESGLVKKVFEKDIVYLAIDGKKGTSTLSSLDITDVEGPVLAGTPINVVFELGSTFDIESKDRHVIGFAVNFQNVSVSLTLKTLKGWRIESASGLGNKVIENAGSAEEASTVSGVMTGGVDQVGVTIGRIPTAGEVACCVLLVVGVVVIVILVVFFVIRRRRKRAAIPRVEYVAVAPGGHVSAGGPPPQATQVESEKRLNPEERTFGREYHNGTGGAPVEPAEKKPPETSG